MSAPQSQDHAQDIRIFISHSTADNILGVRLAADLRRVLGDPTAVWYDSSGGLHPGDAWWQTIVNEVEARRIFLVIWSPDARDSRWVNDEIDLAWQEKNSPGGKTIIPLIWRPCDLRADLRTRQAISFANLDDYDERFAELLAGLRIATDLAASGTPPVVAPPPMTPPLVTPPLVTPPLVTPLPGAYVKPPDISPDREIGGAPAARPASNELLLFSIDSLWPPTRVPIRGAVVSLGRESGNDILLADPAVSRFHLRLVRQRSGWRVETLASAKPMYVNGERRATALLGHGDQVVIGGTVLRLEQPAVAANATTIVSADARTVMAFGLTPELTVETQQCRFTTPLRAEVVTIGRAPECTLVIPSPLVSAHQAVLRHLPDGGFALETAHEARNDFALDGRSLKQRQVLRNGDVLVLGSHAQNQYIMLTYAAVFDTY